MPKLLSIGKGRSTRMFNIEDQNKAMYTAVQMYLCWCQRIYINPPFGKIKGICVCADEHASNVPF